MTNAMKKCISLVKEEKFEEAFELGYENNILICEDWIEIDGIEYYEISIEDDLFRFRTDEIA